MFKIGAAMNVEQSADHIRVIGEVLLEQGWTPYDVERAGRDILADPELMRIIRFAGAVTPEVYAAWRSNHKPAPMLVCADCAEIITGLDYVTVNGRTYCAECWSQPVKATSHEKAPGSPADERTPESVSSAGPGADPAAGTTLDATEPTNEPGTAGRREP